MPEISNVVFLKVDSLEELIDQIGAGCDPQHPGPVVCRLTLWNEKTLEGRYYTGPDQPNVTTEEPCIYDDDALRPHVVRLVEEGKPLITRTGEGESEDEQTLMWSLA